MIFTRCSRRRTESFACPDRASGADERGGVARPAGMVQDRGPSHWRPPPPARRHCPAVKPAISATALLPRPEPRMANRGSSGGSRCGIAQLYACFPGRDPTDHAKVPAAWPCCIHAAASAALTTATNQTHVERVLAISCAETSPRRAMSGNPSAAAHSCPDRCIRRCAAPPSFRSRLRSPPPVDMGCRFNPHSLHQRQHRLHIAASAQAARRRLTARARKPPV